MSTSSESMPSTNLAAHDRCLWISSGKQIVSSIATASSRAKSFNSQPCLKLLKYKNHEQLRQFYLYVRAVALFLWVACVGACCMLACICVFTTIRGLIDFTVTVISSDSPARQKPLWWITRKCWIMKEFWGFSLEHKVALGLQGQRQLQAVRTADGTGPWRRSLVQKSIRSEGQHHKSSMAHIYTCSTDTQGLLQPITHFSIDCLCACRVHYRFVLIRFKWTIITLSSRQQVNVTVWSMQFRINDCIYLWHYLEAKP